MVIIFLVPHTALGLYNLFSFMEHLSTKLILLGVVAITALLFLGIKFCIDNFFSALKKTNPPPSSQKDDV